MPDKTCHQHLPSCLANSDDSPKMHNPQSFNSDSPSAEQIEDQMLNSPVTSRELLLLLSPTYVPWSDPDFPFSEDTAEDDVNFPSQGLIWVAKCGAEILYRCNSDQNWDTLGLLVQISKSNEEETIQASNKCHVSVNEVPAEPSA